MVSARSRVLVLTSDKVGPSMAGPAIRSVEIAGVLAGELEVTLASRFSVERDFPGMQTTTFASRADLEPLVASHDVVVAFAGLLAQHDWIGATATPVVADAYDPVLFEVLEWSADAAPERREALARDSLAQMLTPLKFADVVLCASSRQRHLIIGMLTALGRVNPRSYAADRTLDRMVRVVPFGLPTESVSVAPSATSHPFRGAAGPFAPDDFVLLWGGGIYEWLDPLTLVEAVARLDDHVKACFMGGTHPTPVVPPMPVAELARKRAADLGLLDSRIVFHDGWVPYHERAGYLLDADVGVSLHQRRLEAEFAFRTRLLDYLWGTLPILCSDGDTLADLVRTQGLGEVVAPGDSAALASTIEAMRGRGRAHYRAALERVASDYTWARVAQPVLEACREPAVAPDRDPSTVVHAPSNPLQRVRHALGRWRGAR